jgi:predicted HicB family RNase H-like nuclease
MKPSEVKRIVDQYTIELLPLSEADGGGFQASYRELASTIAGFGETPDVALADLSSATRDFIECESADLKSMPSPFAGKSNSESGRITLRLPKYLHTDLVHEAEAQGVSLNALIQS